MVLFSKNILTLPMAFLNRWDQDRIYKKDQILEFEFLIDNDFITEIEDEYFYLNQPFATVEKVYYDQINEKLANELSLKNVNKEIESFIKKFNKYNEAKDIAESLMGKIADLKNCTIKEIHNEFGLQASED